MKERLIGAAVLVVLGVWLIPWLLDGPDDLGEDGPVSLQLPVPQEPIGQFRTETIDLRPPRDRDSPVIAPDDPDIGRRADTRSVERSPDTPSIRTSTPSAAPDAASGSLADASADNPGNSDSRRTSEEAGESASERTAESGVDGTAGSATASTPAPAEAEASSPPTPSAAGVAPAPTAAAVRASPPPQPASATGDWALQLGSFGDEANARRLAERVSSFGYAPQISNYRAGGRTMYRVRIGPHETRARAEAAATSLSAHGFVAQVVTVD